MPDPMLHVQYAEAYPAMDSSSASCVLVVEDDPALGTVMQDVFAEDGYRVLLASAGCQALQLAIEHKPSAIVIDGDFASRSGWKVLSDVRGCERTRHIPVLVISALPERIPEPITLQLDAVVGKPFDLCVLEDQLRRVLQPGSSGGTPTTGLARGD